MTKIISVNAQRLLKRRWWRFWENAPATPRRPHGGTNKTPFENFQTMKLLKVRRVVDAQGRWWVIETRQDIATGLILTRTRRITD